MNRANEILYESEAALRLVDHELLRLRDSGDELFAHADGALAVDPSVDAALDQVTATLDCVRASRVSLGLVSGADAQRAAHALTHADELLNETESRLVEIARLLQGMLPRETRSGDAAR